MTTAYRKLSQSGIVHHVLMSALIIIVGFALFGTFQLVKSNAASKASTIIGLANRCLDNRNGAKASYNRIDLFSCNGTAAQSWTVNGAATVAGSIVNNNGYCLDVYHSLTTNYARVNLFPCNGTAAQAWTYNSNTGQIVNPHSGKCLDDFHALATNGNQIDIFKCNGTVAQKWTIKSAKTTTPSPDPSFPSR